MHRFHRNGSEENHQLITASDAYEMDGLGTSQRQFNIVRKPLPQYAYNIAPVESEDAAPHTDPNLLSWRPAYLKSPVLCGFVAFFCLVIAALEIMFQTSQRQQGLANSDQKLHYLWTYGPSAVFIITSALWARVEYQAKELAPWRSMVGKETEASKSILLDYVSATAPTSIVYALLNRHYVVALITICGLLMKVLVVSSTALLVLSLVSVNRENVPIVVTSTFAGSAVDVNRTGTLPLTMLSGIQEKRLQYPPGMTADLAYQSFRSPTNASGAVLGASVQAFMGNLECEEAQLKVDWWYLITGGSIPVGIPPAQSRRMEFSTEDCRITDVTIDASERIDSQNTSGIFGTMRPGWCVSSASAPEMRLIVAMGSVITGASTKINPGRRDVNVTVQSSRQFICKPIYSMMTAHVTLNQSDNAMASVQSLSESKSPNPFSNLQAWNFLAIQYYDPDLSIATSMQPGTDANLIDYRLFLAMRQANLTNTTYLEMMKGDNLVVAAKKLFGVTSALYSHISLRRAANITVSGTSQASENRLRVKELPVRVMESILVLITISTIFVMFDMRRLRAVPRCPATLLDLAVLLSRSEGFMKLFQDTGALGLAGLRARLAGRRYISGILSSGAETHFCVNVSHQGLQSRQTFGMESGGKNNGWQPFTVRLFGRVFACIVLVLLIVALETLLWYSQKHAGFSDVTLQGYVHYSWAYVPATVLVLVSLWFSAIDFDLRCLGPYFGLEKGGSASRTVGLSYLNDLSGTTLINSIKKGHWTISTTSLASLIGSTLTIAVAGCFLTRDVPIETFMQLRVDSRFNSESIVNSDDTAASLILYANMSYPAWTYDELALPQLSIVDQNKSVNNATGNQYAGRVQVRTAATRSDLNCTIVGTPELNHTVTNNTLILNINNGNCWRSTSSKTEMKAGYFGTTLTSWFCFEEIFLWGRYDNGSLGSLTVAGCNETLNEVDVDVTLLSPALTIDGPPIEHRSTVRKSKAYLQPWSLVSLPTVAQSTNSHLDPFFLAVVYGRDGTPLMNLGNSSSTSKVLDRIKHVVSTIRAQHLGESLRTPTNATDAPPLLSAKFMQYDRLRLVQDPISSRILEALLAVMLLCTITAALVQPNIHNVIPKNPCSIAAKASLLADSSLVTRKFLPEDAEKLSDEELQAAAKGTRFGIGWFKAQRPDGSGKARLYKVETLPPVLNDRITHDIVIRQGVETQKEVSIISITSKRDR